jgi:hypothetical protein
MVSVLPQKRQVIVGSPCNPAEVSTAIMGAPQPRHGFGKPSRTGGAAAD